MRPVHWRQANVTFADRGDAEHLAVARVGPVLRDAEGRGLISAWFFIRKEQWRFRWLPTSPTAADTVLHALTGAGEGMSWSPSVCELEPVAFGGPAGMDAACALFHADSHQLLRWLETGRALGRRETSILLCGALLRGAGLDWFEQGDVWVRVSDLRPHRNAIPADPERVQELLDAMHTLMAVDARGLCNPAKGGPLAGYESWISAFEKAGQTLAALNRHGQLERGLRAVLAHHLIFHFNRAGLSGADQKTMAALAVEVVFHSPRTPLERPTDKEAASPRVAPASSAFGLRCGRDRT